jgi:hypothetical protein
MPSGLYRHRRRAPATQVHAAVVAQYTDGRAEHVARLALHQSHQVRPACTSRMPPLCLMALLHCTDHVAMRA